MNKGAVFILRLVRRNTFFRLFFSFTLFCCVYLVNSSCSKNNEDNDIGYNDTSQYIISSSEIDSITINIDGRNYVLADELVFPNSYLLSPVFRIPSIIISNKGSLLVSCENRSSIHDTALEMDNLVARKSSSDTEWAIKRVFKNDKAYGRSMNPIFVIDRSGLYSKKGRIYLFTSHINYPGVDNEANSDQLDFVYKYSDDDGLSWSCSNSIKKFWNTKDYTGVIPSAANGIQLQDGTLIIPTMVIKNGNYYSGIAYSSHKGEWIFSKPTPNVGDNECTVYLDNKNNVILDCRTEKRIRHKYLYHFEKDEWYLLDGSFTNTIDLKAQITKCVINNVNLYLMSFCDTPSILRQNITLYGSLDGINFKKIYRIQEGECQLGYSNVDVYGDKICLVYETLYKGIRMQDISSLKEIIVKMLSRED